MHQNYDQELNNPCLKEQNLTYTCLNRNDYNKEKCELEFHNYNICKKFWGQVKSYRKRKGIRPYLPLPEDREQVKQELFEKLKN